MDEYGKLTVRLPAKDLALLKNVSATKDMTIGQVISQAINHYVETEFPADVRKALHTLSAAAEKATKQAPKPGK